MNANIYNNNNLNNMDANKQYLTTKIDPILEPMVTQILLDKPADPIEFMLRWLEKLQKKPKAEAKKDKEISKQPAVPVSGEKAAMTSEAKNVLYQYDLFSTIIG